MRVTIGGSLRVPRGGNRRPLAAHGTPRPVTVNGVAAPANGRDIVESDSLPADIDFGH